MNYQQLELMKDLITEMLSKNEALDNKTRTHLGDMLTEVKEEMKVLKGGLVDEMNSYDDLTAEQQLSIEDQNE